MANPSIWSMDHSQVKGLTRLFAAMWAMLVAVHQHNCQAEREITSIACPGLGTCTGMVAPEEAARQMALAYRWSLEPLCRLAGSWQQHVKLRLGVAAIRTCGNNLQQRTRKNLSCTRFDPCIGCLILENRRCNFENDGAVTSTRSAPFR
jgi:hypothetical protein